MSDHLEPVGPDEGEVGDEHAYLRLVEPRRGELRAHCYRLLGSHADAEDALQEALLRAWRGLGSFDGRGSVRSWLYRIASNASIDAINARKEMTPAADPTESLADRASLYATVCNHGRSALDGLELEGVLRAALELLPPRQLRVLVLRAVLGFTAREGAELLGTTEVAVNSALQRARATLRGAREAGDELAA